MTDDVVALAKALIACPSVTPHDAGCQPLLSQRLQAIGFHCESMRFDEVDNLWARYGEKAPLVVFAGHTDVVPPGPFSDWASPPFQPEQRGDFLYGRGACDMKGAIAAMVIAAENFIKKFPTFSGSIAFLLTSDEEGPAINGTQKVIEKLTERGIRIDYCIIGEPSSEKKAGDQIRVGRRGSLHGKLTAHGKQGHVAHPHLALNPIHQSAKALDALATTRWDEGNAHFPATSFQITNIHAGTGVANVIPGHLDVLFNFRFGTASAISALQQRTENLLKEHGVSFDLAWTVGGEPFLTKEGALIAATVAAIKHTTGDVPHLSTGGGTSDGRFIAKTGAEIVELGTSHATAHQVNEHIAVQDLSVLTMLYTEILKTLFRSE